MFQPDYAITLSNNYLHCLLELYGSRNVYMRVSFENFPYVYKYCKDDVGSFVTT